MATTKLQQIGIWIIAVVLTVGTIGSFIVLILANDNNAKVTTNAQRPATDSATRAKASAQANADSSLPLVGYSAQAFDASAATSLQKEILVDGTGDEVKATDSINASYFGWTSDGKIFDSSLKKDASADAPVTFSLAGVIQGWTKGLTGQRAGSTVKLTIPADQAYGTTGSGIIPANAPLQFIVVINKIDNTTTPR